MPITLPTTKISTAQLADGGVTQVKLASGAVGTTQLADGMACRTADLAALCAMQGQIDHIVQVTDAEVAQAMRDLFACTHNVAEGAGAASFAAAYKERDLLRGQVVGTTLCGGNVDSDVFAKVLQS